MTKQYDNFADLITFTRASTGTALRHVGYGPEIITNSDFSDGGNNWAVAGQDATHIVTFADGTMRYQSDTTSPVLVVSQPNVLVAGVMYRVDVFVSSYVSGAIKSDQLGGNGFVNKAGLNSINFTPTVTGSLGFVRSTTNVDITIDYISVKEVIFDRATDPLVLFNHPTNTPRIEFDINGNRKGILIEEARTNLLRYSEELDNAAWTKTGTTVLANNTAGPFGGITADRIVENTATSQHTVAQTAAVNYPDNSPYTASIYVKADGRSIFCIESRTKSPTFPHVYFDLANGAVLAENNGASGSVEHVGNGWYHCRLTANALTGASTPNFICGTSLGTSFSSRTYEGDGTSGVFLWGAQLEAGSFPTSYIPTAGAAASRSADVASIPTSAFGYNADKGTVVVDYSTFTAEGTTRIVEFESNNDNRVTIFQGAIGEQVDLFVRSGGVEVVNTRTANAANSGDNTIAAVYAENDFAITLNGGALVTDTSATVPPVDNLMLGRSNGAGVLNGHIKSLAYYPRKLTPAQLQRLTS